MSVLMSTPTNLNDATTTVEQGDGGGKKRMRPSKSKLALETKMARAKKISGLSLGTHLYKYKNRSNPNKQSVALQVLD